MDLLTHVFLPLALVYGARMNGVGNRSIVLLSFFAILPDSDVVLGVHRGLFHSLLFVVPVIVVAFFVAKKYAKYVAFFLFSHLFLDFITGGIPFLYPVVGTGFGMEFPLVLKFGSLPAVVEWLPRIIPYTPIEIHGRVADVFSSFGVASFLLFLIIYYRRT